MNCGSNNSCNDRMNRCCEKPRRVMPRCEAVKPSCESMRPSCGGERPMQESMRPSCCGERPMQESMRPSCCGERPMHESMRPGCGCEMPQNECVRPSRCCREKEAVQNIIVVNDCSCQEFMRLYDLYNCTADKARREFMGAEKGLNDAVDCIKMGLCYNEKAKELFTCMDEFLDSMNEEDNTRNTNHCGCNMNCGCNTNCNNSCMPRQMQKCDPCMKMREELKEMICNMNKLEEESLECTKAAVDKLMEARELNKCICELKKRVAKNCYPKC